MEGGRFPSRRKSRYEGEDTSPTTKRELRGFYAYGVAAEVFAVCGVGEYRFHLNIYTIELQVLIERRLISPGDPRTTRSRTRGFVV
jgi:hypothetical protein